MIPELFKERIKLLLKDEYSDFISALENESKVKALRLNHLKFTEAQLKKYCPFKITPLEFCDGAYYFDEEKVGGEPLHHAGAFYVQDPSAISTVAAAKNYINSQMTVLDMCASPGGKSAHIAEMITDGFLISNEINLARAKILRGNIERMGIKNCAVTNTDSFYFAENFSNTFDFIIVDAPCSGEGMMRKYTDAATENWSIDNIMTCAERQSEILRNAAKSLKDGGYILYSTCTFSLEENEMTVNNFLKDHEDFKIVPVCEKIKSVTSDGVNYENCSYDMTECRRFYPHKSKGEGQFICIMKKSGELDFSQKEETKTHRKSKEKSGSSFDELSKEDGQIAEAFLSDNLELSDYQLKKHRNEILILPKNALFPEKSLVCGVVAGEIIKNRFSPHHQLFSAYGKHFLRKVYLSGEKAISYLKGETVETESENGWCAVFVDESPCGGGKAVDGTLKNHYPKGLRLKK